jgi:hypothetical protein
MKKNMTWISSSVSSISARHDGFHRGVIRAEADITPQISKQRLPGLHEDLHETACTLIKHAIPGPISQVVDSQMKRMRAHSNNSIYITEIDQLSRVCASIRRAR